jgi:hypothetical protein
MTWTLTNNIEKMLMAWERKILRKIYGPTKENGQWRIKTNFQLYKIYMNPKISAVKIKNTARNCLALP